jgi:5-formyltetrahydrofolate cyclo-ligase
VTPTGPQATAKAALRTQVLAARREHDAETRHLDAERLADNVLALIADLDVSCLSTYASLDDEPGTRPLVRQLHATAIPVLLPVLLPDRDLDWAYYRPDAWRLGRFGLVEPASPPLGVDALGSADVIVCPGVAGSMDGGRLGRGGGSYDRALARARPSALRCLLLYDDEVVDAVPMETHDQYVDVIVTPTRILRTSAGRL